MFNIRGTNIKVILCNSNKTLKDIAKDISENDNLIGHFKTTDNAEEIINQVCEWILQKSNSSIINKVCLSMFGPIDINKNSKTYGTILNTPKIGWAQFSVIK